MSVFDKLKPRRWGNKDEEDNRVEQADAEASKEEIDGDRGMPSVHKGSSAEGRMKRYIIISLVGLVAFYGLYRYYSQWYERRKEAQQAAGPAKKKDKESETAIPVFKALDPPAAPPPATGGPSGAAPVSSSHSKSGGNASGSSAPPMQPVREIGPDGKPVLTPAEQAIQHRLKSPVLYKHEGVGAITNTLAQGFPAPTNAMQGASGALSGMLSSTATPAVRAFVLPDRDYIITKGIFIDCTLEGAIESSLAGMVTCIGTKDVRSDSGRMVLLDKGTRYTGEYRATIQSGQASLFILWSEAKTPLGVTIELASPATDNLGRAGVSGYLDTHFWDKFGAAFLFTAIQTGGDVLRNKAAGGSNNAYPSQGGTGGGDMQGVVTELVKPGLQISNSIAKNQGEHVGIYVSRLLDFRSVYEMRVSR